MIYHYICTNCQKEVDLEIPMGQDLPSNVECSSCHKGILKHDFANQVKSQSVEIPPHMQATSRYAPKIKYKKDATIENL